MHETLARAYVNAFGSPPYRLNDTSEWVKSEPGDSRMHFSDVIRYCSLLNEGQRARESQEAGSTKKANLHPYRTSLCPLSCVATIKHCFRANKSNIISTLFFFQLLKVGVHQLVLLDVTLDSSGRYTCQITESKPPFHTEQMEKNLTVISKYNFIFVPSISCFSSFKKGLRAVSLQGKLRSYPGAVAILWNSQFEFDCECCCNWQFGDGRSRIPIRRHIRA